MKMYVTINIGNPHMTLELLKGNPRMLMYTGCNGDSCIQYVSFNGDSRVRKSRLRKIIWQDSSRVNASLVMPIYIFLEKFNPKMSFCVPT